MSRFPKYLMAIAIAFSLLFAPVSAWADHSGKGKAKVKTKTTMKMRAADRVERDVTRLESLLAGMNTTATISTDTWKRLANEANMLANRIHANVIAAKAGDATVQAAKDLRMHVRLLHKEAHDGDALEARRHATEALPFAYRLDDWADMIT